MQVYTRAYGADGKVGPNGRCSHISGYCEKVLVTKLVTKTMHPSTQAKELTRVGCDKTSDTNK